MSNHSHDCQGCGEDLRVTGHAEGCEVARVAVVTATCSCGHRFIYDEDHTSCPVCPLTTEIAHMQEVIDRTALLRLDLESENLRLSAEVRGQQEKLTEIHWWCGREGLPVEELLSEIISVCDRASGRRSLGGIGCSVCGAVHPEQHDPECDDATDDSSRDYCKHHIRTWLCHHCNPSADSSPTPPTDVWKTVAGYAAEDVIKLRRALVWAHERLTTDWFGDTARFPEAGRDVTNTAEGIRNTLLGKKSPASAYDPDPDLDTESYQLFVGDSVDSGRERDDV